MMPAHAAARATPRVGQNSLRCEPTHGGPNIRTSDPLGSPLGRIDATFLELSRLAFTCVFRGCIVCGVQTPARDDEDDVSILRRVARGERDALGELYDGHAGRLMSLGLRILGNPRESEDVVHDVFLEAWRTAGDYDPARGSVRVWLLVRMRSRCLDRLRSHAYARSVPIDGIESPDVRDGHGAEDDGSAERALDGARLSALLSELPAPQRVVLELGYFRGLSFQEIADELHIPVGTVKSRAGAAMATLRRELGVSRGGNAA